MPRKKTDETALTVADNKKTIKRGPGRGKGKGLAKGQMLTLDDGSVIDLDSYDWGDVKLNLQQKLFIFWFTYPHSIAFHRGSEAARRAGYSVSRAWSASNELRKTEKIQLAIKRIEDTLTRVTLEDAYHRVLQEKVNRAFYSVSDFYDSIEIGNGEKKRKIHIIKDLDSIPADKKSIIDGIDYRGQAGIPVYVLPNRQKEMDDIITLRNKMIGDADKQGGYDTELTIKLVQGALAVKAAVTSYNEDLSDLADGYIDDPATLIEEE